jgi:nucleotide-binding universal stress UspA family protein
MVVINQRRVHGRWAERPLGTIFQTVSTQAGRPILAVPGTRIRPIQRVVLAYDGSPKAQEALFVFQHLLTCWGVEGVMVTVAASAADRAVLKPACDYVESCGDSVKARLEYGASHEQILRVMGEEDADLLVMGSYGYQPLVKAVLRSTVDRVLRQAWFPVLICR